MRTEQQRRRDTECLLTWTRYLSAGLRSLAWHLLHTRQKQYGGPLLGRELQWFIWSGLYM